MIKFRQGWIENKEGVRKDIIVKAFLPNKAKDIVIGSILIVAGVAHLTVSAFKNGSKHFEEAGYNTLNDLGILK